MQDKNLDLIKRLVDRLEHLSADLTYAHRASGLRGSLLKVMEILEMGEPLDDDELTRLDQLVESGFEILRLAAEEIGARG